MNFSDLLNEDGQGSRELDAWLAENISNETLKEGYISLSNDLTATVEEVEKRAPHYTTRDSIDPIWGLAKEYFERPIALIRGHEKYRLVKGGDYDTAFEVDGWGIGQGKRRKNERLAIAETLFKAYQKENENNE